MQHTRVKGDWRVFEGANKSSKIAIEGYKCSYLSKIIAHICEYFGYGKTVSVQFGTPESNSTVTFWTDKTVFVGLVPLIGNFHNVVKGST